MITADRVLTYEGAPVLFDAEQVGDHEYMPTTLWGFGMPLSEELRIAFIERADEVAEGIAKIAGVDFDEAKAMLDAVVMPEKCFLPDTLELCWN